MPSHQTVQQPEGTGKRWSPFEVAWQDHVQHNGQRPRIESFLELSPTAERNNALKVLLKTELERRRGLGETPVIAEYRDRFPGDREVIEAVFRDFDTSASTGGTTFQLPPDRGAGDNVSAAIRYSSLTFLAEGGLGEVFRAQDEELHRPVAVKFVKADRVSDQEARERFRIEAEVTGRLCHPGVVPVYTAGEGWDGRPFYAMRLIEGQNFEDAIAQFHNTNWEPLGRSAQRLALHQLIRHLIAASETVAYAHDRGVLHLDIKPANIMLGRFGETMVVDWGLAQFIEHTTSLGNSRAQAISGAQLSDSRSSAKGAGTLGYMSPEQLPDGSEPVTALADIYSLGATLYHLLTSKRAFSGSDLLTVTESIRQGDFRPPREIKACSKALEAVSLKAMALRPENRYASAEDFAAELKRWLADEPVRALKEPWFERVVRAARRRKKLSIALVSLAAVILASALLTNLMFARLSHAADESRIAQLKNTAAFAAQQYGYEIDRRWRILSELAADPELPGLVLTATGQPIDAPAAKELDNWLDGRTDTYLSKNSDERWFIVDATGIQVARNPTSRKTLGKSFRGRTYFHGGPVDIPEEEAKGLSPICSPHMSTVFKSKSDGQLTVAFSVPIWRTGTKPEDRNCDGDVKNVIGILAVSVRLGDFVRLAPQDASLVLVDLRPDTLEDKQVQKGLILDHPRMDSQQPGSPKYGSVRLAGELIEKLEALRAQQAEDFKKQGDLPIPLLLRDYHDPAAVTPTVSRVAAFEPVFVVGRDSKSRDAGLVVIIQERVEADQIGP